MAQITDEKTEIYLQPNLDESFDGSTEYSDECYSEFVDNFVQNKKKRLFFRFVKRSFDIVASLCALIILAIPMLVIAIAVKLDSKGPAIFKQQRLGKNGKPFCCYKFRTMKTTAPHDMATSVFENPEQYITRVGKILRKLSLDELPQLWCCLIGTMSVIGYRPLVLTEEKCNDMRKRLGVFAMRPGISGYAQVYGRDNVYYKNKALMDAEYVKEASIALDVKLMLKTVVIVVKGSGNNSKNKN